MIDILFGQSYYLRFDPKLWAAQQPYPPLGTLYAAAIMRQAGYAVALFDAMLAESEEEWAAALDAHRPRFAVLYEDNFNYLSKMCLLRMRQAAFTMAGMAAARGCTVIVAGSDASDHAAAYLRAGAHYVLLGEGEATLAQLLDRLTGRTTTPLDDIHGLAWLEGVWEGSATFMTPAGASPVKSWERVVRAAGGTALVIQGRHFSVGSDGQPGRLVHDAAALLTFDERTGRYRFVTQTAEGRSGSFEGRVENGVFSWFIPRPGGQVRYDIVRNDQGQWHELGFNCNDGAACTEFFRMTLDRKSAP